MRVATVGCFTRTERADDARVGAAGGSAMNGKRLTVHVFLRINI
jgi:hypothetical protein